jgi:hypothetical protein
MQGQTRSSAVAMTALAMILSVGLTAACGGDDGGGPEDQFIGRWFYEPPDAAVAGSTGFTLACTDPIFGSVDLFPSSAPTPFLIFPSFNFEHGELASLVDTAGNCNILNYDVKGNSATVPNPDPYLKDTADPTPACLFQFNLSDATGYPIAAFAIISPGPSWTFKMLPDRTPGGARRAQLIGSATAHLIADNGTPAGAISTPDCTYAGSDTFYRLTQP